MIRDMINEDTEEDQEDENPAVQLSSRLQSSKQNLQTAKKFVTDLEHQLASARSLVNHLEVEVARTQAQLDRERKKKGRTERSSTLDSSMLDSCSVCLETPRPHMKVFQCPEGHVFCEECHSRPELKSCPECRVSLVNVCIRNRTLERLIQVHYGT